MKGLVYGALIGDAMGIQFQSYEKKKIKIKQYQKLEYADSSIFPIKAGHWSDDGDHLILLLQTMNERVDTEMISFKDYAKKLHNWYHHGIKRLNKGKGVGCGNTLHKVITHNLFTIDPHKAVKEINSGSKSNGALMKIAIIGLSSKNREIIIKNTMNICLISHNEQIVLAACLCLSLLVFYANKSNINEYDSDETNGICDQIFVDVIKKVHLSCNEMLELQRIVNVTKLSSLQLDEECKVGYCLKALGCAFWAFKNIRRTYEQLMKRIYAEGGDTDTNGCCAGAIIGVVVGYSELPKEWIYGLRHKDFINECINGQKNKKGNKEEKQNDEEEERKDEDFEDIKYLLKKVAGAGWRKYYKIFKKQNVNDDDLVIFEEDDDLKELISDRRIRRMFSKEIQRMVSSDHENDD